MPLQVAAAQEAAQTWQATHAQQSQELQQQVAGAAQELQAAYPRCLDLASQLRHWLAQLPTGGAELQQWEAAAQQELTRLQTHADAAAAALTEHLRREEEVGF